MCVKSVNLSLGFSDTKTPAEKLGSKGYTHEISPDQCEPVSPSSERSAQKGEQKERWWEEEREGVWRGWGTGCRQNTLVSKTIVQ